MTRPRGRPALPQGQHKQSITIRISPEVAAILRGYGRGYGALVEVAVREYIERNK